MSQPVQKAKSGALIRKEFPFFAESARARVAYLDNAASSQKPKVVIEALSNYLSYQHANIHRGAYELSANATLNYDKTRKAVADFIGADSEKSIVFTRGTTEAINLVSYSFEKYFEKNDSILLTILEHHSNIVPWQLLAQRKGLNLIFADIDDDASLNVDDFISKLKKYKPKLVSFTALSNAFGSLTPYELLIKEAHAHGAKVLLDVAQAVTHIPLNVSNLDVDFLAFSGHKLYGPTGVGVLYAKEDLLEYMDPFQGGGDMISEVTIAGSSWAPYPQKFEAGTPAIAEVIAFQKAIEFVQELDLDNIAEHEASLFNKAFEMLKAEANVSVYGPALNAKEQISIIPFNIEGIHPHDIATVADVHNVQIRAGHHCAMPALKRLGLQSTARVSFAVYSTLDDIEMLISAIRYAKKKFG